MNITLNGEARDIDESQNLSDLINDLNLDPMKIAVERNEIVIPRSNHSDCTLSDGDVLEIIQFVGGG